MKAILLNTPEDMEWLINTHLGGNHYLKHFKCAELFGNEDCPEKVNFYFDVNPHYLANPDHIINLI